MNKAEVVFTLEDSCRPPVPVTDDLDALRRRFAALMDQAQRRVSALGLEPDDCILERSVNLRFVGSAEEFTIEVESLTDRGRFLKPFHDKVLRSHGGAGVDRGVEIMAVSLRGVRVPDFPPRMGPLR